jgi:hypothetical protein
MLYLCEREIGFDTAGLGFPAVDACRAIVLVTAGGLFGYHLNGNLNEGKKIAFAGFVNRNPAAFSKLKLFVASTQNLPFFHGEIRELAKMLGYKGTIYWNTLAPGSNYVHYDFHANGTCIITSRAWSDVNDNIPGNKGGYVAANRAIANGPTPLQMYTNVNVAGLAAIYPAAI